MPADRFAASHKRAEKRGRRSENFAAIFLMLKLYRILGWRVRTRAGEIDLIARASDGLAVDSVGPAQKARIACAAVLHMASRPSLRAAPKGFDIVTVFPRAFSRHRRDAWRPED
jgi:putative endonuclease